MLKIVCKNVAASYVAFLKSTFEVGFKPADQLLLLAAGQPHRLWNMGSFQCDGGLTPLRMP